MIKKILLSHRESDFAWLNFFSGIMLASAINTLTGYCTSKNPSEFAFLSSMATLLSSGFLFALYQTLNRAKQEMINEIESYDYKLSTRDVITSPTFAVMSTQTAKSK